MLHITLNGASFCEFAHGQKSMISSDEDVEFVSCNRTVSAFYEIVQNSIYIQHMYCFRNGGMDQMCPVRPASCLSSRCILSTRYQVLLCISLMQLPTQNTKNEEMLVAESTEQSMRFSGFWHRKPNFGEVLFSLKIISINQESIHFVNFENICSFVFYFNQHSLRIYGYQEYNSQNYSPLASWFPWKCVPCPHLIFSSGVEVSQGPLS